MTPRIKEAFAAASMIRAMMEELIEDLDQIAKDESISTQARHLCIQQICSLWGAPAAELDKYADAFLEENVEHCRNLIVEGFDFDGGYVAGKIYDYAPRPKVELLNKDDRTWGRLVTLLAQNGYGKVVQKRLTASYFVGRDKDKLLELCQGMVNVAEVSSWSIRKPTVKK